MLTPLRDLKVLLSAMPRIQAEEALAEVHRLNVGSGNMKPADSQKVLNAWSEIAQGNDAIRKPASTPAAMLAFAQMTGVKVKSQVKADSLVEVSP